LRLEGIGQLKKFNDFIENRNRDLPACSIVPQPTTLLRGLPYKTEFFITTGVRTSNPTNTRVLGVGLKILTCRKTEFFVSSDCIVKGNAVPVLN
jgi:hypothetical protein